VNDITKILFDHADNYLSLRGAARILDVSHETIRNWVRSGQLPADRLSSGQYLIRKDDLRDFYNAREAA